MLKKFFVSIDGSSNTKAAFEKGIEIAEALKEEIRLLCSWYYLPWLVGTAPAIGEELQGLENGIQKK